MTSWIVVFLLANDQLGWMPFEYDKCVAIEEAVELGKNVGFTGLDGKRVKVIGARCVTKEEAAKRFGFKLGTEV